MDVGGGAEGDEMLQAFKILNDEKKVKSIFVNIFGGILFCDKITASIITAAKTL